MKQCSQCKENKELEQFSVRKASGDGLNASCKYCMSTSRKSQYKNNPEKYKTLASEYRVNNLEMYKAKARVKSKIRREAKPEYFKEYYENNKEKWAYVPSQKIKERHKKYAIKYKVKISEYGKKYRELNKEELNRKCKIWKKVNSGKIGAINAARRARKIKATIGNYKEVLEIIYKTTEGVTDFFHVDHIIPLKNKNVCGLHVPWNLQILTRDENLEKSNRFDGTRENESWKLPSSLTNPVLDSSSDLIETPLI